MNRSTNRPAGRLAHRAKARVLRTAMLVVVGALALSGCDFSVYSLPLPGGADLGDNPYTVKVEFRDVLDLVPQSSVKVDDVTVGKVDDIKVSGQHAQVTLQMRGSVKLPDNAEATIRQTSLLGEKFVSLAPPTTGAGKGRLGNNDVIPLSRSGRNPEVEEVLGALSLLLNGGGVAQLKTISMELNKALGGREGDVKSVLKQIDVFTEQLDTNKDTIVKAIESLNRLAVALNKQKPAITQALDELPRAVASINRQRDDLVKMLRALADLSSVGTRVIGASKAGTIDSLRALAPTLTKLSEAGDSLPKALQVFLTYPFVDAVVGTNPAQARNLHLGDYTNLSAQLDIDLSNADLLGTVCSQVPKPPTIPGLPTLPDVPCDQIPRLTSCLAALDGAPTDPATITKIQAACGGLLSTVCSTVTAGTPLAAVCALALGKVPALKIPKLKLPLKVPSLSKLEKCLTSGEPLGPECKVLSKQDKLRVAYQCTHKSSKFYTNKTCDNYRKQHLGIISGGRLGRLPVGGTGGGSGSGGGGGGGGGILGGGGLPGLNRSAFGKGDSSNAATRTSSSSDLGAMLVWGMVQR